MKCMQIMWCIIHMSFSITPLNNINYLFGSWLNGVQKDNKAHIRVGVCAILWAMWNVRNDFVFNEKLNPSFMQVILLAMHWIHMWSYLWREECRLDIDSRSNHLEMVARAIFTSVAGVLKIESSADVALF
jgi:hypothetical protein